MFQVQIGSLLLCKFLGMRSMMSLLTLLRHLTLDVLRLDRVVRDNLVELHLASVEGLSSLNIIVLLLLSIEALDLVV